MYFCYLVTVWLSGWIKFIIRMVFDQQGAMFVTADPSMEYLGNDLAVSGGHMILGDLGLSQPNADYDVNATDVCLSEGNTSNQNKTIVIGLSVVVFL